MSGPKTSKYKLTPAQRRIIAKQREHERQLRDEKAYRLKLIERAENLRGAFSADRYSAELLAKHSGSDDGFAAAAESFSMKLAAVLKELDYAQYYSELEDFARVRLAAEKELAELARESVRIRQLAEQIDRRLSRVLDEKIAAGFDCDIAEECGDIVSQTLDRLRSLIAEPLLSDGQKSALKNAEQVLGGISDKNFAENYIAVSAAQAIATAEKSLAEAPKFEWLLARYESLCGLCGAAAESIPHGERALIEEKIRLLEARLVEQSEQAYIAQAVDEVMEEMGYNLLGRRSAKKKSGGELRSELFSYNSGTAVNITYNSDRITMELGGLDTADRLPTPAEADRLCADMTGFCAEYREFERRLAEKGVIPEHISLLPPEPQYAQIINTEDFTLCEGAEVQNISEKKRRDENTVRLAQDDQI